MVAWRKKIDLNQGTEKETRMRQMVAASVTMKPGVAGRRMDIVMSVRFSQRTNEAEMGECGWAGWSKNGQSGRNKEGLFGTWVLSAKKSGINLVRKKRKRRRGRGRKAVVIILTCGVVRGIAPDRIGDCVATATAEPEPDGQRERGGQSGGLHFGRP
jgi:hypothetical protein